MLCYSEEYDAYNLTVKESLITCLPWRERHYSKQTLPLY